MKSTKIDKIEVESISSKMIDISLDRDHVFWVSENKQSWVLTHNCELPDIDCLWSGHIVKLSDDVTKPIGDIVVGDMVIDKNGSSKRVLAATTRSSCKNDVILRITISIGGADGVIICNHKHRLMLENGNEILSSELKTHDKLLASSADCEVVNVTVVHDIVSLTDITVEDTSTFHVIPFGCERESDKSIVSHNSDFSDRDALVKSLRKEFGEENVYPIVNFNTLQIKSLVKDVSKLYGIPFEEVNEVTRKLDDEVRPKAMEQGENKSLFMLKYDDCVEHSPDFATLMDKYPQVAQHIKVLYRQLRTIGKHAGGVIVTQDAQKAMPLIASQGEMRTPWSEGMNRKDLEVYGLVKFDLLGLETLRIFENCVKLILKRKHGIANPSWGQISDWYQKNLSPDVLDTNDQRVYENVFANGRFAGIFQFTAKHTQKFIQKFSPKSIGDLAVATSIYRPGPLAAHVDKLYIGKKQRALAGEKFEYDHPAIEKVLGVTYGYPVFQEQLMSLAAELSGMNPDECDKLRKTILKRSVQSQAGQKTEIAILEEKFVNGAVKNGLSRDKAQKQFEDLAAFASYGFNKCLHEDELVNVYTREGQFVSTKKIADVSQGEFVESRDEITKSKIFVEVVANHDNGTKRLVEVEFEDGSVVRCTMDHKFRATSEKMLPLHVIVDFRLDIATSGSTSLKFKSIKDIGQHATRDLEVDHEDHQFVLANGAITSNSHAIAYSIESYQCAWLCTHYEPEWLCAYVETMIGNAEERETAITELKSFGYEIGKVDINVSGDMWTIDDERKRLMPSFKTVKGIGEAAIEEMIAKRPYHDLDSLFWNEDGTWKHSKFNRRVFESLVKIEAFDSMDIVGKDKMFANYKHMHDVVIAGYDELKKRNGKDALFEMLTQYEASDDWSPQEKLEFQRELVGDIRADGLVPAELKRKLEEKCVPSVDEVEENETRIAWFVPVSAETKTTKNGKQYIQFQALGSTGIPKRLMCWGVKPGANPTIGVPYLAEIKRDSYGLSTTYWKLREMSVS